MEKSTKKDRTLRRQITLRLNKLLAPVRMLRKTETAEKDPEPYGIIGGQNHKNIRSKSVQKHSLRKHLASFGTIKRLLKVHEERKCSTEFRNTQSRESSDITPILEEPEEAFQFYTLDRHNHHLMNYETLNADVKNFSKNHQTVLQIQKQTQELVYRLDTGLEQSTLQEFYNRTPSSIRKMSYQTSHNPKPQKVHSEISLPHIQKVPSLKFGTKVPSIILNTSGEQRPALNWEGEKRMNLSFLENVQRKRRMCLGHLGQPQLDDKLKELGKRISEISDIKEQKTVPKKKVTFAQQFVYPFK